MLLDKDLVMSVVKNSKNIEDAIENIDILPDNEDAICDDIIVDYSIFIRGSRIQANRCVAKLFINEGKSTQLILCDEENNSGFDIYFPNTARLKEFFNKISFSDLVLPLPDGSTIDD